MTTIACDGKSMVGDGLIVTERDTVVEFAERKVWRLKDGSILGAAGAFEACEALRQVLNGEAVELAGTGDFDAIRLLPTGKGLCYSDRGGTHPTPCSWPVAIGSGAELALGAMLAGASPKRAVQIACERDVGTGGKLRELKPRR